MAHFIVCPACSGYGTDSSTAYAITGEDLDLACGDDWDARREYVSEVASLTARCACCEGRRVVTHAQARDWNDDADYRAMVAMERRAEEWMGC